MGKRARSEYLASSASRKAAVRASSRRYDKSRLVKETRLRRYVLAGLKRQWSAREIQERLKKEHPLDMIMRISHEADLAETSDLKEYFYTDARVAGTKLLKATTTPGTYVLRYYENDSWTLKSQGTTTITVAP